MFIELDRSFRTLVDDPTAAVSDSAELIPSATSLKWADLLDLRRVVVLSEAGAGKTEEIRHAAQSLRQHGKVAFFLRLEHISTSFEAAFEEGSHEEFEAWLDSTQEGWLLLDSIDESRLRDPLDFEAAVRTLGCRLRPALQRVRLILTGRSAAWRPSTDLALCLRHLPYSVPILSTEIDESDDEPTIVLDTPMRSPDPVPVPFTIVSLEDLSVAQARLFATAAGIRDVDELLEAIERADGWSFTTRPLDLEELLGFWQTNGRIGSRLELLRASIDRRLQEQDQTRDEQNPLSLDRTRVGAQLVAAACTLTLQQTIAVPDRSRSARGLQLKSFLGDWSAKEHATLLQRPIFDEEIYGTVRFHHRSAREYLTAEWFAELLKRGTSRKAIEGLFFRKQYGLNVVPPVLRPILSWLAVLDQRIQERALLVAPEVLLSDGDPSSLLLTTRQRVLDATCAELSAGSPRPPADYSAIQRFADDDLAQDIKRLLATHKDDESQVFLLRMVWQGRLTALLQEALAVALSPNSAIYARKVAIRAIRATGTEREQASVRLAFAQEASVLNREVLAELLETAPRSGNTSAWLCDCLERVAPYHRYSVDFLQHQVCGYVQQLSLTELGPLLEQFSRFLGEQPVIERGECDISTRNAWLLMPAAQAVHRLVKERHKSVFGAAALTLLQVLPNAKQYDVLDRDDKLDMDVLVQGWAELNFALFWHTIEAARQKAEKKGERVADWWRGQLRPSSVGFTAADFDAALEFVSSRSLSDDKLVALTLAFRLYVEGGRRPSLRHRLKVACKGKPALVERLQTLLHPPPQSSQMTEFRRMEAAWKRRSKAHADQEIKNRTTWRKHLVENVDKIRDPGLGPEAVSQAQHHLLDEMRRAENCVTMYSSSAWRSLEPEFGVAVARALRDGAVAYWRRHRPILASEGAALNSISQKVVFGLAGLAMESAETEGWATGLGDDEVEIASRYAIHEINGYPAWFPSVFMRAPNVVRDLMLAEVDYELNIGVAEQDTHYVIYGISWRGEWMWDVLAPALVSRLATVETKNLRNLQLLLNVVQGAALGDEALRLLSRSRALSVDQLEQCAHWYAVWIGVAADEAIPALFERIMAFSSEKDRTRFVMIVLTQIVGSRHGEVSRVRRGFCTAKHLKTLYLLAHEHIRFQDDIDRAGGGVYSPELRDEAQEAREHLLALLRELPGKDAFMALSAVAREHPNQRHRLYIERLAKAKAEADAAGSAWSEPQVWEFHDQQERMPRNHRELFELATLRLFDLKEDLEHGDSSDAPMMSRVASEGDVRTYIGNWLRNLARGRYGIPQEEELADAKRPDLRFHGIAFDAPVPIELKLADNWTGPKLFERLETQLCGDYLRDRRSSCGIFLLVYRGEQKSWSLPNGAGSVDFSALVEALHERWMTLSPNLHNVDDVLVVGIDLTKRAAAS
ncbi:hypothetical protein M4R22_05790 [Acidovorax sp. GBBC 3334]|uniref:NACHT domain-containing protein n=1 Tax=Acidovorax sp. GBBC 3334 TaxID=2940496 RepID=UPI0023040A11|nr:hypothetical protein [Acidovorax sp. GBBC 3334]MDA8454267.1 hypothetical protein [Acidovorax sp. GBBC 3334]